MTKSVEVTKRNYNAVLVANGRLATDEHLEDCPVFHKASADCVWPIAVCVPDDFEVEK